MPPQGASLQLAIGESAKSCFSLGAIAIYVSKGDGIFLSPTLTMASVVHGPGDMLEAKHG